ncbi:MAG: hypothetical protein MK078_04885 [Crocinitomicaceae bacterium]|nr:hypothetical protein [Crocinitomicaceae bacterium]
MKLNFTINDLNQKITSFERRFNDDSEYSDDFKKMMVILNTHPNFFNAEDFSHFSLKEIHTYIERSHDHYRAYWLFKIEGTIEQLVANTNTNTAKVIKAFFDHFKNELLLHMRLEEAVILKFVENHLYGVVNSLQLQKMVVEFIQTHSDNIILDLPKIFSVFEENDPSLNANLIYSIFKNQLSNFQNDLKAHSFIEDEVYVPKLLGLVSEGLQFNDN